MLFFYTICYKNNEMKTAILILSTLAGLMAGSLQTGGRSPAPGGDPAIRDNGEPGDSVARLNLRLQNGEARLSFDGRFGYLLSLLDALGIPLESQLLLFSKTSLQAVLIEIGRAHV